MKEKSKDKKDKKDKKAIDGIILLILIIIIAVMATFTITRQTENQEIILMEIYKSAGPDTSTSSMEHYYIYENTNIIKIRNSNPDGSNTTTSKEISQDLIDDFKDSLDEYITQNPTINTVFYINERYTIEYSGKTTIVPNPSVAEILEYDPSEYAFYNTVESFINNINN